MTATTVSTYQSDLRAGRDRFPRLLYAEWTKFLTVRGWVIGMIIAALVTLGIALLNHGECGRQLTPNSQVVTGGPGCSAPIGPGGQAVTDNFYFVHQPLASNGSITARVTSFAAQAAGRANAGLAPWSKAGIIIKASTRQGSAYAAIMVTGAHGVRMQYDYTGDIAGPAGSVSAKSPRWLRLTRSGELIRGYESADGSHWKLVGSTRLAGLPATVPAGLFTAARSLPRVTSQSITGSSAKGSSALATAVFDHVTFGPEQPGGSWTGTDIGSRGSANGGPGVHQVPGFQFAGRSLRVSGSGDIAPDVPAAGGNGASIEENLIGVFGALIAAIIVAAMFMTAEYRRGLLRVTLAASPRRGRVLGAKAAVIGSVAFVAGLAGSFAALMLGDQLLRSNGTFILPVSALTEVRVVAGTAALVAVAAVLAL